MPVILTLLTVLALPVKFAVPPFKLKLVPLMVSVPLAAVAFSPKVPVPVAQTLKAPKVKLWLANKVSVEFCVLFTTKSAATVKVPVALPELTVVTVTLLPFASALVIEVFRTVPFEVLFPDQTLLVFVTLVLFAELIVIFVGSINHSPFLPLLLPFTLPSIVSSWPEVSTKPPSPALLPIKILVLPPI